MYLIDWGCQKKLGIYRTASNHRLSPETKHTQTSSLPPKLACIGDMRRQQNASRSRRCRGSGGSTQLPPPTRKGGLLLLPPCPRAWLLRWFPPHVT